MESSDDLPLELNNLPLLEHRKWSTETCWPGRRWPSFKTPARSQTLNDRLPPLPLCVYLANWQAAHRGIGSTAAAAI